ncbi:MAG: PDZ domain-containing protein [Candidatus Magasanikbacteria bacterium]|nr:PDZ domain-containing protein [Candidatus Magasanikbacteria bacterium]
MKFFVKKYTTKTIIPVSLAILTFGFGLLVGLSWNNDQKIINDDGSVEVAQVLNLYKNGKSDELDFDQFWELWDKIKEKYVVQPVNDEDLYYGAMEGLVSGLKDPYSVYFRPKKAEEFVKDLAGEFEGIGAEIGIRNEQLTIIAPLPDSPAEKSGLQAGDKVYAIDGEDTFELSLDEAVSKIRGPKGSEVVLTVSHDGYDEIEEVSIVRDTINVPTVSWEQKENDLYYLRISYFNEDTWTEFDKAVREIIMNSPKGVILDLRSNPGGFLQTSVDVAGEWVESGVIVRERYSDGRVNEYKSRGKHRFADIPTVILVDGGTASGSEIVAGALQDYSLATIVGVQTFGKGSVQDFETLSDGSALKLTVARWYTPNDRQIDEEGIMPDVIVEEMFVAEGTDGENIINDKGMEKAIEILKQ